MYSELTDAQQAQVEQLRQVMARDFGITDTPTWDPAVRYAARPSYRIALRSYLTRRQILDRLDPQARAVREQQIAVFTPDLDLDSPEIIETTVHAYIDRRPVGGPAPREYRLWLYDQVTQRIPDGYTILGRWEDYARPVDLLAEARAVDAEPRLPEAVRTALARGMSATEVAEVLGVSRSRVYQLRDGKR